MLGSIILFRKKEFASDPFGDTILLEALLRLPDLASMLLFPNIPSVKSLRSPDSSFLFIPKNPDIILTLAVGKLGLLVSEPFLPFIKVDTSDFP